MWGPATQSQLKYNHISLGCHVYICRIRTVSEIMVMSRGQGFKENFLIEVASHTQDKRRSFLALLLNNIESNFVFYTHKIYTFIEILLNA